MNRVTVNPDLLQWARDRVGFTVGALGPIGYLLPESPEEREGAFREYAQRLGFDVASRRWAGEN